MAKGRTLGVSGSAVLLGTAGLYLVYVGVRDVPFFDGLRSILRKQKPTGREKAPWEPTFFDKKTGPADFTSIDSGKGSDKGIDRLRSCARNAYPILRSRFPGLQMLGYGLRPSGLSDHPKGLAIDVMTTNPLVHEQIIRVFRGLPGAKYWISRSRIANAEVQSWRIRPYDGVSPHNDHVHLSFYDRC